MKVDIAPGQKLDHFQLISHLADGGMGSVWKAFDTSLERPVALKIVNKGESIAVARFVQEARAQAKLNHENIVRVFYIGQTDRVVFFAMEWIDGVSLEDKLQGGPLSWVDAIDVSISVAKGLRHAAENGVLHRDIKPANVLVSASGEVKIADFGISKAYSTGQGFSPDAAPNLTDPNSVMGTPIYISPEQLTGEPLDFRTDFYALGGTLFEAVVGHPPFQGSLDEVVRQQILNKPPFELLPSDAGSEFVQVIATLLEKQPNHRFSSHQDLIHALEDAKPFGSENAPTVQRFGGACVDMLVAATVTFWLELFHLPVFSLLLFLLSVLPSMFSGRTWGQSLTGVQVVSSDGLRLRTAPLVHIFRTLIAYGGVFMFDIFVPPAWEIAIFSGYYLSAFLTAMVLKDVLPQDFFTGTRVVPERGPTT